MLQILGLKFNVACTDTIDGLVACNLRKHMISPLVLESAMPEEGEIFRSIMVESDGHCLIHSILTILHGNSVGYYEVRLRLGM